MTGATITSVVESLADDVRQTLGLAPQEPLDKSSAGLGGGSMEASQLGVRLRRVRGFTLGAHELLHAADVQRLLDELVTRPRAEPAGHPVDAPPTGRAPLTWQQRAIWYQSAPGDIVRVDSGGRLHCSGRRDRQFESAGVRFGLGEVEATALRQPGVVQAVALISASRTGPRLHLFLILAADADPDRAARAGRADLPPLPGHLIVHHLRALPCAAGGKVDRRLLADLTERGRPHTTGPAGCTDPPRDSAPRPVNGTDSTDLNLWLRLITPLPRNERLSLVQRLIGSVLSDKETR